MNKDGKWIEDEERSFVNVDRVDKACTVIAKSVNRL